MQLESEKIESALWWLRRGFWLLPVYPNTKRLFKGYGPYLKKIKTSDMAKFIFCRDGYNLAVMPIGATLLLDFDDPQIYQEWAKACPEYAKTYTERTPRGGYHVTLYALGEDIPRGITLRPGAELKSFFVVAPSVVDGKPYHHGAGEILDANPVLALSPLSIPGHQTPYLVASEQAARRSTVKGKIEQIKYSLPVLTVLAQELPDIKLIGRDRRWITARCPFHKAGQEKEPSFWIDTQRNLWGCHACGEHGDVINLWAKLHGEQVPEAIRELSQRVGAI
jgi:hypothetical protein